MTLKMSDCGCETDEKIDQVTYDLAYVTLTTCNMNSQMLGLCHLSMTQALIMAVTVLCDSCDMSDEDTDNAIREAVVNSRKYREILKKTHNQKLN